jgi:site-specific recombinase XerC
MEEIMQIKDALDAYLLQLEADGRSRHTLDQARRHVLLLARFVGAREIEDVGHQDLARFLTSTMAMRTSAGRTKKPNSANAMRSSLRAFFSYVHAAGLAPTNAARLVRRAICGPPMPRGLSDAERANLIAALEAARTPAERRDRVLIHVMLGCGLRLGSAVGLDVEDVDLVAGELRLRQMKGSREDLAYLPADVAGMLRDHIGERTSGPVFVVAAGGRIGARQVHRRLVEWGTRAGVVGLHPHRLRHTFGTRVYRASGDLLLTARALGHRSIASTTVYAQPPRGAVRSAVLLGA